MLCSKETHRHTLRYSDNDVVRCWVIRTGKLLHRSIKVGKRMEISYFLPKAYIRWQVSTPYVKFNNISNLNLCGARAKTHRINLYSFANPICSTMLIVGEGILLFVSRWQWRLLPRQLVASTYIVLCEYGLLFHRIGHRIGLLFLIIRSGSKKQQNMKLKIEKRSNCFLYIWLCNYLQKMWNTVMILVERIARSLPLRTSRKKNKLIIKYWSL